MTIPFWCLLGFLAWTLALLLALGAARGVPVLLGRMRANDFPSGVPHGSDRHWRLNRAHLNCLENLPIFASRVFLAHLAGVASPTLDELARAVLVARVGQSTVHLLSGSHAAVRVRFSLFSVQGIAFLWMGLHIASHAGA